jgi:ketosteroid isomerase-like protein
MGVSEENVEIVRRMNAAVNAHDLDAWMAYLDPAFEFVDHMGAVGEESGSGIDGIRRQAEGWLEAFPDFRVDTEEFIDAGDRVVTVTHWHGTGAGSGLPYSQRAAEIVTLRDGKIVYLEMGFEDKAAALEAAGLEHSP